MARQRCAVVRDRALMRLRDLHPAEYARLYAEELAACEQEDYEQRRVERNTNRPSRAKENKHDRV